MKTIKLFLALIFITYSLGCSPIYDVKHDYDQQVDFTTLKTYNWMPVPEQAGMNQLVIERVKNAVNAELKTKGLRLVANNADFLIAEHLGKQDKVQVTDWGYSYSAYGVYGGYRGGYGGPGGLSTYNYEEGSLILDFVDAKSKKLIWRGALKAEVQGIDSPEKSEALINRAVNEILKKYPPSVSP